MSPGEDDSYTDDYSAWLGKTQILEETISAIPVARLSAALGYPLSLASAGDALPPCWHWLYFNEAAPAGKIALDGHPQRGGFLPPVALPRRMWAGSRLHFHAPLRVGDSARRESTITGIEAKRGRSGELLFVTVEHRVLVDGCLCLEEQQDLVYRGGEGVARSAPAQPPQPAQWTRTVQPDPVLLFRYSALTFNAHRIHYDRDYAVGQEGYRGLVVHGPLIATLLLDLVHRNVPDAHVASFDYRSLAPLQDVEPFRVCGSEAAGSVDLWAESGAAGLAAQGRVQLL
ncbi:MAG: MaoC family dehydratase N-terminal domain-containing protein [Halioglobus sp.]|nr:MaoC family dehydratase N-terminal domain-containing protein [Halioglobus sp.]